jgi:DNA-binding response OmpR family regulator/cell division septation protein DedD
MFETILIIDSDTENTRRMIETLEARDYLVFTAPNRDAALTMARKVRPRLIFINPAMPEGGGLELCSVIHEEEEFKEVPIIVLSTFEGATDPRYTSLYGIIDSLRTPCVPEELVSKTEVALSKQPVEAQSVGAGFGEPVEGEGIEIIEPHDRDAGKTEPSPRESEQEEETKPEREEHVHEEIAVSGVAAGHGKIAEERLSAYAMKRSMRRRGTKNALLMPVIGVAAVMILVLAAILFYERDSSPDRKVQSPATAKPVPPSQEQTANVAPAPEAQKPEQSGGQGAVPPVPKADVPSPVPGPEPKAAASKPEAKAAVAKPEPRTAAPKAEVKPSVPKAEKRAAATKQEEKTAVPKPEPKASATKPGTRIYSAQMGAFKSEKNADILTRKYKEKGYEAFVYKTETKASEPFYRVLIGKFKDKKEAVQMVKSISAKEGVQAILFRD